MATAVHEERVSSGRTQALFVSLALLFLGLACVRGLSSGFGYIAAGYLLLGCFFLFYAINYQTLIIRTSAEALRLEFGVFWWTVPWDTVANAYLDDVPLWRVGGAGVHFTMIRRRFRVLFNFLEHQRVVVELSKPRGPVRDVVFSTRQPERVLALVAAAAAARGNASEA